MDFNHPGPLLAHLSKTPDGRDVREYDGSGEWIKIYSSGFDKNEDGSIHWQAYNYEKLPARVRLSCCIQRLFWPGKTNSAQVYF